MKHLVRWKSVETTDTVPTEDFFKKLYSIFLICQRLLKMIWKMLSQAQQNLCSMITPTTLSP